MKKLSTNEFKEIISLLKELLKWTKFQAWGKVKDILLSVLEDDEKKIIYYLSDGKHSSRKIAEKVSVGFSTIVRYWNEWSNSNIVEAIPARGGGSSYKKIFELENFGITIPNIKK